jgi:beta-D-xylosidase 4
LAKLPICDQNAPIEVRARSLLAQLNVTEKISRIYSGFGNDFSPAIPRLGLPSLQWINDALHGLTGGPNFHYLNGDVPFNSSTSFPSPINFAATFDDDLAFGLGSAIATEARAFTNANRGGVDLWTPNINPFRDPRWGRGQEVPGEDPYTVGRYAYNFVIGMQGGEDPRYYKAVADCKHYAAYDLDHWHGEDRTAFSANVSQQELVEYFLPPFERCIRDARAGSVMCSYNALNEIPTCADDFLIQTIARDLWEFDKLADGWVVSDCDAVANIWDPHHYTSTPEEAAAAGLKAGTDLDCGGFYRDHLPGAYAQGLITDADLDRSVLRLTQSLIRIGYFDDPKTQPYRQYGIEHVNSEESHRVSYLAALESLTLLKNSPSVLPIDSSSGVTIALIGPLVNDSYFVQGNYRGKPPYVTTTLDALMAEKNVKVTYVQGADVASNDTSRFDAAVNAAKAADYTIYVGGLTENQESEGHDRDVLTWPGVQAQLISALAAASKKPLIVLAMGGGQIDLSAQRDASNVGALLWIGYPSMHGGRAIAEVLFGRYSPSGRLVTTSYPASYVSLSMEDMELRPNEATGNPGRTYKWSTIIISHTQSTHRYCVECTLTLIGSDSRSCVVV